MKHLKLFFALFAMLALGVGNAWGADATLSSISTKNVVTSKGGSVSTTFGDVTCTVTKNSSNEPGFYTSSGIVRYYSTDVMKLSVGSGNVITKIVFTMTSGTVGTASPTGLSSDSKTWTGSAESVSFTGSATVKISKIVVTYEVSGSTTPDPEEPGTSGETVTYVLKDDPNHPTNGVDWFSGTIDQYTSWTATKGTNDTPKYYDTGTGLRVYNGGKFTITSTKVMTSITLTFASGSYTFSASNTTNPQTVTPNAKSYEWSVSRTCRLQKIEITYAADGGGSGSGEPAVSPTLPETQNFVESFEVTMTAEAGAKIYYTKDGSDPTTSSTLYNGPFTITETTTIKAIAAEEGKTNSAVVTATYTKVEPTGTFTLHTGDLIEGDYVIYYNGKAMKATVSSDRLGYVEVTPSNNEIVNPDVAAIWHIAPSGENWTIYNNDKGYAAGNGTNNKASLIANLTGDNASKAAWTVTASDGTYEFVNVWNQSKSVNATLRNNGNYGFACYATGIGGALSLYRKAGAKYNVIVSSTTNGTVTADPTPAEAGTTITLTVTPDGGYVLDALTVTDANSNPVSVTDNKFKMPASDVTVIATFKVNEKPAATLTLSKNGVAETFPGSWKQDDVVTLPSITNDCVKEFVGWSANPTCKVAPEYAAGDSYTLTATAQTLYAVYATAGAGETLTITPSAVDNDAENDIHTFTIDAAGYSLTAKKNSGSSAPTINASAKDVRIYAKGTVTLTAPKAMGTIVFNISENGKKRLAPITASVGTIATQASGDATVTWTGDATEVTFTVGDIAEFGSENTKAGQLCFGTINVTTAGSYSNYSTTCAAALEKPTFSVAEGTYTETKSIELSATEGDIYYTLDGTDPTASNTQYTTAIVLDECGEYTIKAIAISSDSESPVASATYTINLPIPANSDSDPYTTDEAKDVYASGCYNDEWVYVTGTVQTAQFYSSSGSYTITLTDGFQFYYFFKDDQQTKFADGEIETGDVLVACGQLSEHNGNCQLAKNCYLVSIEEYTDPKTDISNTIDNPYTVTQADELIDDITSDLTKTVFVKGVVTGFATNKVTIRDTREGTEYIELYKHTLATGITPLSQGDLIIATGTMAKYNGTTYQMNEGCQVVWKKAAATIEIANVSLEVGETHTIAATIAPAEAASAVTYTIKSGSEYISLAGNVITANAVGTATITATIADCADYMGNSVDFTVNVTPESTSDEVVILAELDGKWYAMKGVAGSGTGQLAALEVTYFNGTLYNVADADKASITWTRTVVDGKATFVNNGKYLKGGTSTDLNLAGTVDDACKWMWNEENGYYTTNTSGTIRTFLYRNGYNFKNYGVSQAGKEDANGNYSELPVVTVPVYATGDVTYTRATTAGKFGTICLPFGSTNYNGAEFFEFVGKEEGKVYLGSVTTLVAGTPYIFLASATEVAVYGDGTTAATPGSKNGLVGTFTNDTEVAIGNYILKDNALCQAAAICWVNAYRAYIVMEDVPTGVPQQMPGRRYIGMSVQGENETTGFENITAPEGKTVKAIVNGQLIIIRDGEMYNAQGVRL